jgi:hypothetical protein
LFQLFSSFFIPLSSSVLPYLSLLFHYALFSSSSLSVQQEVNTRYVPALSPAGPAACTDTKNNILLVFFARNQQEMEVFTAVPGRDMGHPHGHTKQLYR